MKSSPHLVLTGIVCCLSLLAFAGCQPNITTANNSRAANANQQANANSGTSDSINGSGDSSRNPERLIDLIKSQQGKYVRESYGLQAGQCFTDVDYNSFEQDKTTSKIVGQLRQDGDFRTLVSAIKAMQPDKREDLLARAAKTYKSTWAELNMNPTTAPREQLIKGQTDAGQKAEREIAEAVVDLVKQMI